MGQQFEKVQKNPSSHVIAANSTSLREQNKDTENNLYLSKLKRNCEIEYLAVFKKSVADHQNFLDRLLNHEVFCEDEDVRIFLETEMDYKAFISSKTASNNYIENQTPQNLNVSSNNNQPTPNTNTKKFGFLDNLLT